MARCLRNSIHHATHSPFYSSGRNPMSQVFDHLQISRSGNNRVHIAEVAYAGLREYYVNIAPSNDSGDISQQIHDIYDSLFEMLVEIDVKVTDRVSLHFGITAQSFSRLDG